jgi:3',5'-cyclic AMP phosphodiesterase CpdA
MLKKIEDPANNYSMLFFVGDSVQNGFSDALWKKAFSSFSSVSSSIPTEYVMGNHDAMFGGEGLYKTYLCPPGMTDPQRQCLTKRIDVGRAHFLVLDVEWELQTYTKDQKQWLVQQLSEIPKDDWCIVVSHTFYYSSGSFRDGWAWYDNQATIRELTPLFEDYGVDLVLSGHKHDAEVLQKNGVTYVVLGAFGGPPDPERTYVSPASLWYKQGVYAFADVTIENSTTAEIRIMDSEYAELYRTTIRQKH